LAQYLRTFFPHASYATRQTLLLDAEKAEAVRQLWRAWGKRLDGHDGHERSMHILESVVKDMRREATGEAVYIDVVREWFRHEVSLHTYYSNFSDCKDRRLNLAIATALSEIRSKPAWKRSFYPCEIHFGNE